MARILFIAGIVFVAFVLVKSYFKKLNRPPRPPSAEADENNKMVRCAHCGVHAPRAESIAEGGQFFCSEEHRRLAEKK